METTRITVPELGRMKAAGERITMVTAYDWTFARLLDAAGVELLLVGDSLGNVVQGHETTLPVTLDEMVYHTRLVTRGALNSPWGLALAPDNFGRFSGALLVGNFGDGHINAYNPDTGAHLGQLRGANRHPIAIEGLWSLRFGNGNAAKTNELIFSSGPDDETHGLLGKLVLAS